MPHPAPAALLYSSELSDPVLHPVRLFSLAFLFSIPLFSQSGSQVLVVVNRSDATSVAIGDYYRPRRSVPTGNVCPIDTPAAEEISWDVYKEQVEAPIARCLAAARIREQVLYIVLTRGVPLKVTGGGAGLYSEHASVDSELTLLYRKLHGGKIERAGPIGNPFFGRQNEPFRHPQFDIYLVTRLAGYNLNNVKVMIDRSLAARNAGKFVIDLNSPVNRGGNEWLRTAALLLPPGRVVLDETERVLYGERDVIGYAAHGSNDGNRKRRRLGFQWLPGAIATEFVSTDARTFERPPDDWTFTTWLDKQHWFGGSPQSLSADYMEEGATGASGNVYEPYLSGCVRPDHTLPAYAQGRNLAESFYLGLPVLSWQSVILGDPLCRLVKP
jgi:uncharacterized protein (TIGR03790 family)